MRAISYLLAVGLALATLPAAAQAPASKAQPGTAAGAVVVRSAAPDAVDGILTPFAVGQGAGFSTTASVLSGAAATFGMSTNRDLWAFDTDDDDKCKDKDKCKCKCKHKCPNATKKC